MTRFVSRLLATVSVAPSCTVVQALLTDCKMMRSSSSETPRFPLAQVLSQSRVPLHEVQHNAVHPRNQKPNPMKIREKTWKNHLICPISANLGSWTFSYWASDASSDARALKRAQEAESACIVDSSVQPRREQRQAQKRHSDLSWHNYGKAMGKLREKWLGHS